jgi:hypothetical protein
LDSIHYRARIRNTDLDRRRRLDACRAFGPHRGGDVGGRDVGGRDVGGRDVGGRDVGGRDVGGRDVGGLRGSSPG